MSSEHMTEEDDIGSGQRSPGADETEKEIRKIGGERSSDGDMNKIDKKTGTQEKRSSVAKN